MVGVGTVVNMVRSHAVGVLPVDRVQVLGEAALVLFGCQTVAKVAALLRLIATWPMLNGYSGDFAAVRDGVCACCKLMFDIALVSRLDPAVDALEPSSCFCVNCENTSSGTAVGLRMKDPQFYLSLAKVLEGSGAKERTQMETLVEMSEKVRGLRLGGLWCCVRLVDDHVMQEMKPHVRNAVKAKVSGNDVEVRVFVL